MSFTYLASDDLVKINELVIEQTGGSQGIRELELIESIALKPRTSFGGKELYPDIYLKAAVLFEAIANYHVFIDGNKRTAFAAMSVFLLKNNIEIELSNKAIVKLCLDTANNKIDMAEIAVFIKGNSNKLS